MNNMGSMTKSINDEKINLILDRMVKDGIITNKSFFLHELDEHGVCLNFKDDIAENEITVIYAMGFGGYREKVLSNHKGLFDCYQCGNKAFVNYLGSETKKQCYKCFNN